MVQASDGIPSSRREPVHGAGLGGNFTWALGVHHSGVFEAACGTAAAPSHRHRNHRCDCSVIAGALWYHVVATITGGNLRLYVNGVGGRFDRVHAAVGAADGTSALYIGNAGTDIGTNNRSFDELATYRQGLDADRVMAHYNAGRNRGFPIAGLPAPASAAVLNLVHQHRAPQHPRRQHAN